MSGVSAPMHSFLSFVSVYCHLNTPPPHAAYQALTDPIARRNYELYGNPDGPGAMHFGIALPSWIVEKENSLWVLGLYALVFMFGMPTVVAIWWYRSSKFTADQVGGCGRTIGDVVHQLLFVSCILLPIGEVSMIL